jgi:uncharacterized protein YsxB (DUF464 family)
MITVTLYRTPAGFIRRFTAKGHSGYAEQGADIICAAVSAIAQTVIGSLEDLAFLKPDYILADGHIECTVPDPDDMPTGQYSTARVLMDSLAVGCRQIEASYGRQYVKVKESVFA